jgi:putative ABC transport system substrate-binding protein
MSACAPLIGVNRTSIGRLKSTRLTPTPRPQIQNNSGLPRGHCQPVCAKLKGRWFGCPMFNMRRRDFITLLGGTAAAWPLAARAQQAMPVIGLLSSGSTEAFAPRVRAFRQGLAETGYAEGRNIMIEFRWADGRYERLAGLAADLVSRQVVVIATIGGTPAAVAAKSATKTIPIVFQLGTDPVEVGLVASLGRPGGNVTGVTSLGAELAPKQLELLHELIPAATRAALLVNPTTPIAEPVTRSTQAAARTLGVQLHVLHASTEADFDRAFAAAEELRPGGLVISTDAFFNSRNE